MYVTSIDNYWTAVTPIPLDSWRCEISITHHDPLSWWMRTWPGGSREFITISEGENDWSEDSRL